jgi:hypothetical protein
MKSFSSRMVISACISLLVLGASSSFAQTPDPMLSAQVRLRASRVEAKEQLLRDTDARLEKGIGELVTLLKAASDSKESKTRVLQLKEEVAKALARSIGYYRKKREETRAALGRPDLGYDPEDLRKGLAALDERIEKRVAQIIEMTRSLEVHQAFEKYLVEYNDDRVGRRGGLGWRDDDRSYRRNEDWVQNRRVTALTDQDRKTVSEALAKNITELQSRQSDLESRLASADAAAKPLLEEDLADVRRRLGIRLEQASDLRVPSASGTTEVDLSGARELQTLVKDMTAELKEDFFAIFRLYNELLVERRDLARLKKQAGG